MGVLTHTKYKGFHIASSGSLLNFSNRLQHCTWERPLNVIEVVLLLLSRTKEGPAGRSLLGFAQKQ